jgi:hypothetical protein
MTHTARQPDGQDLVLKINGVYTRMYTSFSIQRMWKAVLYNEHFL